jgi:GMP synthase PP-ATPase subunit
MAAGGDQNGVNGVNCVVYDIMPKSPGTIEWGWCAR